MKPNQLQRSIEKKKRRMRSKVDSAMETSANRMQTRAKRNVVGSDAVWTTQLYRSLDTSRHGWAHYSVGTTLPYAAYVEFGTGSKNVADEPQFQFEAPEYSDGLQSAIIEWVMTKPNFRGERSFDTAFKIARSISNEGTKAQPYLGPAYTAEKRRIMGRVRSAVRRGLRA